MARGSNIIVSAEPKGHFDECTVVGTPTPGVIMNIVPVTNALIGGRFNYEPAGTTAASGSRGMSADGDRIPIAVLLADKLQGKIGVGASLGTALGSAVGDAYVSGDRGFLYFPLPGEELNLVAQNQSGTGDDLAIGDKLIVDDGTGKVLLSAGSPESEPFVVLETITDPTADCLVWCLTSGQ